MHTTLWISMSSNGIIADKNGEEEFLSDVIWSLFIVQVKSTQSVIIGRKAYEGLLKWPSKYIDQLTGVIVVVVTSKTNLKLINNWRIATSPQNALEILKDLGITHTTIAGGATTNSSFLGQNLIDHVIFAIEPVIKGEGILSLTPLSIEKDLKLESVEESKGIVKLRYNLI